MSSWVVCPCGHRTATGAFPNPNVYLLISQSRFDQIRDPVTGRDLDLLFLDAGVVVDCPACGRIIIQERHEESYRSYLPEPLDD